MEAQTQFNPNTNPNPIIPAKKNRYRLLFYILTVVILLTGGYYASIYEQQAEYSEQLIESFSVYLENDQYSEAYSMVNNLKVQDLGIHLKRTGASFDRLIGLEIQDAVDNILKEKEQKFITSDKIEEIGLFKDYPGAITALNNNIRKAAEDYLADKIAYTQYEYLLENTARLGFAVRVPEEYKVAVDYCRQSRETIRLGKELFAEGDYYGALEKFLTVTSDDKVNYDMAQIGINQSLNKYYQKIERHIRQGQFTESAEWLTKLKLLFPDNQKIAQKILSLETARLEEEKDFVPYTGPVQHIFFHPLIAYPELTFDGDFQERGFNEWFVTIPEFEKIIKSLYAKGFILVKITDLYEVSQEGDSEKIVPKQLKLPKGKRPLIISIDDLNYYRYMIENGTVHKLIVDGQEKIATYSRNLKNQEMIAYNNEIITIMDSFIDEHPDFSYKGAKGVIALTGYEGILGYRTDDPNSSEFEQEKKEALQVVKVLKDNGWLFASHSQGHLNVREDTYERLVKDTERWQREVRPLIGPTEVYIYPFGASVQPGDPKFKFLQEAGFKFFCSVGPNPYLKYGEDYILMDRRHIDGIALFQQADSLRDLFDSEEILDPVRPPLK